MHTKIIRMNICFVSRFIFSILSLLLLILRWFKEVSSFFCRWLYNIDKTDFTWKQGCQIGALWDKSRTLNISVQSIVSRRIKMYLKLFLEVWDLSLFVLIWLKFGPNLTTCILSMRNQACQIGQYWSRYAKCTVNRDFKVQDLSYLVVTRFYSGNFRWKVPLNNKFSKLLLLF